MKTPHKENHEGTKSTKQGIITRRVMTTIMALALCGCADYGVRGEVRYPVPGGGKAVVVLERKAPAFKATQPVLREDLQP